MIDYVRNLTNYYPDYHLYLVQEKSGKTVIAIAHRLDSIRAFDNILMFQEGRIVEQGGFNELIEKRQYFHKLYHL